MYTHPPDTAAQQAQAVERTGDLLLYGALIAALHKEGLYNEADAFYSSYCFRSQSYSGRLAMILSSIAACVFNATAACSFTMNSADVSTDVTRLTT
eukprot:19992-Heterococcus_DN1.PRE.1